MIQILGIVLLVGGLIAAIVGLQDSFGLRERAARLFLGRFTQRTLALLIGGITSAVLGLFLLF
ncbi:MULTISPECIES: DUF3185 family protein [unclassified Thioalkalivibrio]|uniref:DUF3185 family protein n=1 Tax=unclassified Thioalkalivibrio TaxID=2621013 RepID=UPI000377AE56|nr:MULTISPECIES: DUF3185 family protein [unclassified Thioalkalivibrio]